MNFFFKKKMHIKTKIRKRKTGTDWKNRLKKQVRIKKDRLKNSKNTGMDFFFFLKRSKLNQQKKRTRKDLFKKKKKKTDG